MNKDLDEVIDSLMDGLLSDLQLLIKQPSVSAKQVGLIECAGLIEQIMRKAGIKSEILYLDNKIAPPCVYGEVKSKRNPNGKTLLFYNHYDVQPEDPVELWDSNPFSGEIKGNYIFGRGSSDDKGELITRIKAVEYYLKETGDVPCNIKFIVEGEEEIGSLHIQEYLLQYREKLKCDAIIWEFGYIDNHNRPIISLGMKGMLFTELECKGPNKDVHSSLAVLIENPAWRLIQVLNSLRNPDGKILIKGWYDEVLELNSDENLIVDNEPFDEEEFKNAYGVTNFVNNISGKDAKRALISMPTCNICGIISGYTGPGAKTVLPSLARAKVDFRLVPKMIPELQVKRLREHLDSHGFGDIELNIFHGEAAGRTDIHDAFIDMVKDSANEVYDDYILSLSSAGTGPMFQFLTILNAPCISIGCTFLYSQIHSPNEFARIDLLQKTTKMMCKIISKFSA